MAELPRSFGPGVLAVMADHGVDEGELLTTVEDGDVSLLRAETPGVPVAVLHQTAPEPAALLEEVDRLLWLAGRGPAPEVLASARADNGDEAVVVRLGPDAVSAERGHPMGPEALVQVLAAALDTLHRRSPQHCPFSADTATLRRVVDGRIERGLVADAIDGPYAGRSAPELAAIFDELVADLGEPDDPVFVHAALAPTRIWLEPSGALTLLGWQWAGVGDRHIDLAAAASLLTRLHGPALVAPFFEAYGFDRVDVRRLDAHQLLAHLLA